MEEHSPFSGDEPGAGEPPHPSPAVRFVSTDEIRELEDLRLEIVTSVTSDLHLTGYYQEAWLGITPMEPLGIAPARSGGLRFAAPSDGASVYLLQLHLFANAPRTPGG